MTIDNHIADVSYDDVNNRDLKPPDQLTSVFQEGKVVCEGNFLLLIYGLSLISPKVASYYSTIFGDSSVDGFN